MKDSDMNIIIAADMLISNAELHVALLDEDMCVFQEGLENDELYSLLCQLRNKSEEMRAQLKEMQKSLKNFR